MDVIVRRETPTVTEKSKKDSGSVVKGKKHGQKVAHISGRVLPEKAY